MNLICPQCNQPIGPDDYNVSTDIAYCRHCDSKHSLAMLSSLEEVNDTKFEEFERYHCQEFGREATAVVPFNKVFKIIGAALSLSVVMMLVVFGILSQTQSMEDLLIFALVFSGCFLPELAFGLFFLTGKYTVSIESGSLRVRTGVFPIRLRKQIDFDRTTKVYMAKNKSIRVNHQPVNQIGVETDARKIGFGVMMSEANKACLLKWLAKHVQ